MTHDGTQHVRYTSDIAEFGKLAMNVSVATEHQLLFTRDYIPEWLDQSVQHTALVQNKFVARQIRQSSLKMALILMLLSAASVIMDPAPNILNQTTSVSALSEWNYRPKWRISILYQVCLRAWYSLTSAFSHQLLVQNVFLRNIKRFKRLSADCWRNPLASVTFVPFALMQGMICDALPSLFRSERIHIGFYIHFPKIMTGGCINIKV